MTRHPSENAIVTSDCCRLALLTSQARKLAEP
jgi:hypothetical protein